MTDAENRRTLWGRTLRYWLTPIWYWGGLYDPATKKPSHTRLTSTVAFVIGVAAIPFIIRGDVNSDGHLGTAAVLYVSLIFAAGFGAKTFDGWLKSRAIGQGFHAAGQEAQAAIDARRAQSDGTYESTP